MLGTPKLFLKLLHLLQFHRPQDGDPIFVEGMVFLVRPLQ